MRLAVLLNINGSWGSTHIGYCAVLWLYNISFDGVAFATNFVSRWMLQCLQDYLEGQQTETLPAAIFKTPLTDFDAMILLREDALPYPDRDVLGPTPALPSSSTNENDQEDDEMLRHIKTRARLHSIPKGAPGSYLFWFYRGQ